MLITFLNQNRSDKYMQYDSVNIKKHVVMLLSYNVTKTLLPVSMLYIVN